MKYILILGIAILIQLSGSYKIPKVKQELLVTLDHVHDGDTVTVVAKNGTKIRVRLMFIDAPEIRQSFGKKSRDLLFSYLKDEPKFNISVYHHGHFHRILAKIGTLTGLDLNKQMVKHGLAWCFHSRCPLEYKNYEKFAKRSKIGIWSENHPLAPWLYRKHAIKDHKHNKN